MTNQKGRKIELEYIETHLVDHCNLNCKGCSHFCPLSKEKFFDVETFDRDIRRLAELFDNICSIRLMGGEPLLHPRVGDFMKAARDAFPRARVALVTNGILLPRQSEDFWKTCAENDIVVDLTRYPIRLDHEKMVGTIESFGVKVLVGGPAIAGKPVEYFDKYLNMKGDSDPRLAFEYCQSLYRCFFLQEGRIYLCRLPSLIHLFNSAFGKDIRPQENDSIDIYGNIAGKDILDFLGHHSPFCRWCLLGYPKSAWGISDRKPGEWIPSETDLEASRAEYQVHWNLIKVREAVNSGQYEKALLVVKSVEDILKGPPEYAEWSYLSAFCYHLTGTDTGEAIVRYTRALEHGYYEFWVRYNRGALLAQMGNLKEAREDLERAVVLNPDHEGARQVLRQLPS